MLISIQETTSFTINELKQRLQNIQNQNHKWKVKIETELIQKVYKHNDILDSLIKQNKALAFKVEEHSKCYTQNKSDATNSNFADSNQYASKILIKGTKTLDSTMNKFEGEMLEYPDVPTHFVHRRASKYFNIIFLCQNSEKNLLPFID